ncbi:hypothetical protein Amet_2827 [Alkaliphilus metalliredigens QYMF]|uniref:DUF5673 domain-containing protein n=1 Tax=Alkaliphilus metalliredigens (strain QYMF) TaxID=293826 RepID=A6TS09_ALKMQ|nr:hypothetical protein [Alkaliphilus metalliredigens]ABR48977.1 hypothetical protein Amet_2827 [Alkaliphilus metalliredigens QYMF]
MELKYKKNILWKIAGAVWFILGFGAFIMLYQLGINNVFRTTIGVQLLLITLISTSLGRQYLRMTSISYITVVEVGISQYMGLIRKPRLYEFNQMKEGHLKGKKLLLSMKDDKVNKIGLDVLASEDIERLTDVLTKHIAIINDEKK